MLFRLLAIPNLHVFVNASLAEQTPFEIGGPARLLADAATPDALMETMRTVRDNRWRHTVIGGGTNLIVDDDGFNGIVLRYTGRSIEIDGELVTVEAGAILQDLVDRTVESGLRG